MMYAYYIELYICPFPPLSSSRVFQELLRLEISFLKGIIINNNHFKKPRIMCYDNNGQICMCCPEFLRCLLSSHYNLVASGHKVLDSRVCEWKFPAQEESVEAAMSLLAPRQPTTTHGVGLPLQSTFQCVFLQLLLLMLRLFFKKKSLQDAKPIYGLILIVLALYITSLLFNEPLIGIL